MLERLGIYGMERIENAVLSGLVTGDPVLLIGGHGSGKTFMCQRLAEALGMDFWAYDASKAMFEDVLGFPDPGSLASGRVDYVPTPISIWGKEFVLIDELSRATPAMQNKWLELIRSRRIMGKGLTDLKYVIAAMNPPSYIGAHPLDAALAGRFAFIVAVPEVSEMSCEAQSEITRQVSEDDAPLLISERRRPQDTNLKEFVDSARERMFPLSKRFESKINDYVLEVNKFLASRECALDGRRLGMMYRSLRAYLAVTMEKGGLTNESSDEYAFEIGEALPFLVPFAATGEETLLTVIRGAHQYARAALNGGAKSRVLVLPKDPFTAKDEFMAHASEVPHYERKSGLTSLINRAKTAQEPEQKAPAIAALTELCADLCEGKLALDPDDEQRLLSFYSRMTMAQEEDIGYTFRALRQVSELETGLPLESAEGFLSFRLARNSGDKNGIGARRIDESAIARLAQEILAVFRSKGGKE